MAAEGLKYRESTDPLAVDIAVDVSSDGKRYQLEQPVFGPDGGAKNMVDDADGKRLPVGGGQIGTTADAAAVSDTSTSSIIGLLKRIAQNVSSIVTSLAAGVKRADFNNTCTIASGGTVSSPIDCNGYRLTGVQVDANWDGTTASFQVSLNGGVDYFPLYDSTGTLVQLTGMAASRAFATPAAAQDWSKLQIVAGSTQNTTPSTIATQFKS